MSLGVRTTTADGAASHTRSERLGRVAASGANDALGAPRSALAGDAGRQQRALPGRAVQLELAPECLYAVRQPA